MESGGSPSVCVRLSVAGGDAARRGGRALSTRTVCHGNSGDRSVWKLEVETGWEWKVEPEKDKTVRRK